MYWIIYFIGFIICYLWCKYERNKVDYNEWRDIGYILLIAATSWTGIITSIVIYFETNKPKPPKWL